MKLAIMPRYNRLGASSRVRMLQMQDNLCAMGLQTDVHPLLDDAYLNKLYSGKSTGAAALAALFRRLCELRMSIRSDLLWIQAELLPWLPWTVEQGVLPRGVPYVVDYDDAVFHRYDMHRFALVRHLLGNKLDRLMAGSALVTAGNTYLANRAIRAGAHRVEIVPTVLDANVYLPVSHMSGDAPRIGWIGSPSTWTEYMAPMMQLLMEIVSGKGARLMVVGAGQAAAPHPLLDLQDWSESSEVSLIQAMDIGIMPLTDTPWAQGKCGYKLIQYMACGLPVVASPVGVNSEIVDNGVDGFLVSSDREWCSALETLLGNAELRKRMGEAGRKKVEARYSLQVWGPKVAAMLKEVAEIQSAEHNRSS